MVFILIYLIVIFIILWWEIIGNFNINYNLMAVLVNQKKCKFVYLNIFI